MDDSEKLEKAIELLSSVTASRHSNSSGQRSERADELPHGSQRPLEGKARKHLM